MSTGLLPRNSATGNGDFVNITCNNLNVNSTAVVGSLVARNFTISNISVTTATVTGLATIGSLSIPSITTNASTTPLVRDGTTGLIHAGINFATAGNTLTLTNKALSTSTTSIVDVVDATKTLVFQTLDSTTGVSTTLRTFSSTNRIITLPNATTTLLGDNNSTAMSNKTIDSGINTIAITNSPLSAANINTIINQALLTTSSPVFRVPRATNAGGGSMQMNPGGITGILNLTSVQTADRNVIFPDIAGTVIIDSGTQTLTNKTIAYGSNTITGLPVSSYGYAAWYRNATQSISNATETTVAFDTSIATDSGVSNTGGTFTINTTGLYTITATVAYLPGASSYRFVYFKKNSEALYYNEMMTTGTTVHNTCVMTVFTGILTVGDTIKTITAQNSGGALSIVGYATYGGNNASMIQITRIS